MNDIQTVLASALRPYVTDSENTEEIRKHANVCMGVMNDRFAGRISQADVEETFKSLYQPRYGELTRDFFKGVLFRAQTQTFDEWLIPGDSLRVDRERYDEIKGLAMLCGTKPDNRICAFADKRLFGSSTKERKAISENPTLKNAVLVKWSKENSFGQWEWRKAA